MPRLLSIDDDRSVHHLVTKALEDTGVEVVPALTARGGVDAIEAERPDAVLLDVMLPDMSGLDAFRLIRQIDSRLPVIIVTAAGSSETAIEAMKLGAFDYLTKPIDVDNLERLVGHAIESRRLASVPVGMADLTEPQDRGDAFVGRCEAMQEVFKSVGRVAPQSVPVLIRGESGTGKELVARAIYQHGARSEAPFLAVNCAALSETLLESELFGHEKGAFTGAESRRIGKFEQCDGGTIFLDEVGDMSPAVQSKVLRLLQQQTFERVGGNTTIKSDVRIVSATNRDLESMCEEGEFRNDLFYRLNGYTITLPPLRDRGDDRVMLLQHFLAQLNKELGREVQGVAPDAMRRLLDYDWPGNVREMQSVVKQAMLHCSGPVLMASALPQEVTAGPMRPRKSAPAAEPHGEGDPGSSNGHVAEGEQAPANGSPAANGLGEFISSQIAAGSGDLYAATLAAMEKQLLSRVLSHTGGNQSEASRILGITRGSLRNKIRSNGIVIGPDIKIKS
ncbi:Nitrogen assimilation regulatory protein [Posidoniimonas corsicana]|uniref:DNA-binding transcriptional regulator NtrC n=1 Tax=Posidoniimonas corsicana TaxID=1938618 RepID=A0A5C5UY94_9BACT|nr:sigma-54 dependent transcriptional regulator [Posidoniimonas corsicana]TWT31314.1 Nitrogen assimilation regulatory protein [Posidoniimonas corsicana]